MRKTRIPLCIGAVVLMSMAIAAEAEETEMHTITADSTTQPIHAPIAELDFVVGHWQGEALGGMCEEIWSPPLGNAMMGSFRMVADGQTAFYEIESIIELPDRVELRLKHFNTDLTGWEEKDEVEVFPLLKLEKDVAWFDGLTMRRVDDETMLVHVRAGRDGKIGELEFRYRLVTSD